MDERAVRAAVERIEREAHGLYMGTGVECRLVPSEAIAELVEAVTGRTDGLPRRVPTDRPSTA